MSARALRSVAVAGLAVLMAVSVALVLLPSASARPAVLPPGSILAVVKVVALAFLVVRIRRADTYAMQWSSMFILLFFAEGIVRATTDPHASAIAGGVEAFAAVVYFLAVLAVLRPLKRQARESKVDPAVNHVIDRAVDR